ncbi:hypothetical protein ABB37_01165 [Leptomonas pyrrhocoris]|uniref:Uncharacterized protein n=1 Tax=Leptomonas pyrrhocoris TaxID=157538 RepID=A0A0M9G826_LEPPY|nr:hypothetical protein ABB37_01165 [Leptomonas pyrrhocoris]KPA84650.1 hypothetical protein ABB37_01165 [Leptomonas pyrrhocoris]|eukprot:XP_015663089.1 hypothetical protein ABB37_01165 [Leptomonas pyrrhocoris]
MHLITSRTGTENAHAACGDVALQREIEETEHELLRLYERRMNQNCCIRGCNTNSVAAPARWMCRHAPELRIRKDPPISPVDGGGTPESITFALTSERRRHAAPEAARVARRKAMPPALTSKHEAGLPTASAVPREFTERLRRLTSAVTARGKASPLEPLISLAFSPIPFRQAGGDVSYSGRGGRDVFLFQGDSCVGCQENSEDDVRHVRFSSRSPRVSIFSVERSCTRAVNRAVPAVNHEASSIFISSDLNSTAHGDGVGAAAQRQASRLEVTPNILHAVGPPSICRGPEGGEDSLPLSRISTVLSPRSSVASYLSLINELRSTLLDSSPLQMKRLSVGVHNSVVETSATVERVQCQTNGTAEDADAATPTREADEATTTRRSARRTTCVSEAASVRTPTEAKEIGRNVEKPSTASVDVDVADALSSMAMSASPIFLQRRDRRPATAAATAAVCSPQLLLTREPQESRRGAPERKKVKVNVNSSPSARTKRDARLNPRQSRPTKKAACAVAATKRKKTVHFRASLEQVKGATGAPVAPQKRGRRAERATPSACAPTRMPPNMCVEQRGFGADILLACGPTLYFD